MVRGARWFGVVVSLAWIVAVGLLAARGEIGIAVWSLYCYFATDANCGETVYIVVHWPVIAIVMLVPIMVGWLVGWVLSRRRPGESRQLLC